MHYQQAAITVAAHQADVLSDALMAHGALSTAIEDANAGTDAEEPIFGEPGMPTDALWQKSVIVALFDANAHIDAILAVAAQDCDIAPPTYRLETVPEQDWVRLTQSQFDPIQFRRVCGLPHHGTRYHPTLISSISNWTQDWLSGQAATPPPISACNG